MDYLYNISKITSLEFAKFIVSSATIKRLMQGEIVCEKGKNIDKMFVLIEGGLGVVGLTRNVINMEQEEPRLSVILEQIMKKKPNF